MKARSIYLIVAIIILIGGGVWYFLGQSTPEGGVIIDGERTYISQDSGVCENIMWTCPPKEAEFMDEKGCGCEPTELTDNVDYRSLDALVKRYLATKVLDPSFGGTVFADFKWLDNVANEETGNVEYNIWALISEYYPNEDGTLIKQGTAVSAPVIVEIEETGRAYIIRGHELPADGTEYDSSIRTIFSEGAQDWIFSQDHSVVITNLVNSVRSQASLSYALPIDDTDSLQEVEEETEEVTEE